MVGRPTATAPIAGGPSVDAPWMRPWLSCGAQSEALAQYCGFMYRPAGQFGFLLLAGNLAWSSGWLGWLAALFTNFVAITSWQEASGVGGAPSWLSRGGGARSASPSHATGMVDVDRDDLL